MDILNKRKGLGILSKYGKPNPRHEPPYHATDIIWDSVSDQDRDKLLSLGWTAIDDWWGWEDEGANL